MMKEFREFDYGTDEEGYQRRVQHRRYQISYDEEGYQVRVPLRDGQNYSPNSTLELPDVINPSRR